MGRRLVKLIYINTLLEGVNEFNFVLFITMKLANMLIESDRLLPTLLEV